MAKREVIINPARDMSYRPYPHQKKVFRHFLGPRLDKVLPDRRAALCWHRRAGKDHSSLALLTMAALLDTGSYLHALPEEKQARKVIWESPTKSVGKPIIEQVIPERLIARDKSGRLQKNNTKMTVTLKNGSLIQLAGFDNYSSMLGTDYAGMVFSEFAVSEMADIAWRQTFIPILAINHGFAAFISTPRGHNHFYEMFHDKKNVESDNWLIDLQTCADTTNLDGEPIITLDAAKEHYKDFDESLLMQEFMCSWESPFSDAIYKDALAQMYKEGRYVELPGLETRPCVSAWDLGMSDETFIIIAQPHGNMIYIVDALYGRDKTLGGWIKELKQTQYLFFEHYGPHDLKVRDFAQRGDDAITRKDIAADLGVNFTVLKNTPVEDGIAAARQFMSRCVFNKASPGVRRLVESLKGYVRERDEEGNDQKTKPKKGWQCHGADAFRYLSLGYPVGEREENFGMVHEGSLYQKVSQLDKPKVPPIVGSIMKDKRPYKQGNYPSDMFASEPAGTIPVIRGFGR